MLKNVENAPLTILHEQSGRPALRVLCQEILNVKVQQGEHSSVRTSLVLLQYIHTVCQKLLAVIILLEGAVFF